MVTSTTSTRIIQGRLLGGMLEENDKQIVSVDPIEMVHPSNSVPILEILQHPDNSTHDGGARLIASNLLALFRMEMLRNYAYSDKKIWNQYEISFLPVNASVAQVEEIPEVQPHIEAVQWIKDKTGLSQKRIGQLLGVTRQTIEDWKKKGTPISDVNRRRLLAVREVLERAASKHKTKEALVAWLDTPRGSDGRTPAQLLEANEINKARLFSLSSPSSPLVRAPEWVKRPIPEKFRTRVELQQEALPSTVDEPSELLTDED